MKHLYEVSFTFFVGIENFDIKDELLTYLTTIPEIEYDVDTDEEDWCVNCIARIQATSINNTEKVLKTLIRKTSVTWDYHYIKGIDTKEYWEP